MSKIRIKIQNEQEYEKIAPLLKKLGYRWCSSLKLPTEYNPFDKTNTKTLCVYSDDKIITYSSILEGTVSVSDFIKSNPLQKKPNKDLIVIYRNGDKVVARNKVTGKIGEAKCHPSDKFNFNTGARLAFDRLMSGEEDEKIEDREQYYNGKVVCTKLGFLSWGFTKGKIYHFVNGKTEDDNGNERPMQPSLITSIEEANKVFEADFIKLVE